MAATPIAHRLYARRPVGTRIRCFVQLLVGLAVMAPGIVALKRSGLGLGPWDVLHDGLAGHTGVDLGTVGILVGIPIVVLSFFIKEVALRSQGGLAAANAEANKGGRAVGAAAATGDNDTDEASAKTESSIL